MLSDEGVVVFLVRRVSEIDMFVRILRSGLFLRFTLRIVRLLSEMVELQDQEQQVLRLIVLALCIV